VIGKHLIFTGILFEVCAKYELRAMAQKVSKNRAEN